MAISSLVKSTGYSSLHRRNIPRNNMRRVFQQPLTKAILGSKEFTKIVIKGIKSVRKSDEITAKRKYEGKVDLEEIRDALCKYYRVKEMSDIDISEKRRGRLMFIYISKERTSAFNREIAELVGGLSQSGVTHQYKRILKRLEADRGFLKAWEKESKSIMSSIKG